MTIDRRAFLKSLGTGVACLCGTGFFKPLHLQAAEKEFSGVLADTTRCIGCRRCEAACAEANNLPVPNVEDNKVLNKRRNPSPAQWTVVNRFQTDKGDVFVKKQCMHCAQPACVSACLVKAMKKTEDGAVIWEKNCMGCRLCMFSCPFDIPKFDYNSPTPTIEKCILCWTKIKDGGVPACVEACPQEALLFGSRRGLLDEARARIYEKPTDYVRYIYGEHEVGGSCWLYLSKVPFEQIGFRTDLGRTPLPEHTMGFLYSVPFILILWPLFLLGVNRVCRKEE